MILLKNSVTQKKHLLLRVNKIERQQVKQNAATPHNDYLFEVFNVASDGIIMTDDLLRIVFINRSAEKLIGLPTESVMSLDLNSVVKFDDDLNVIMENLHTSRIPAVLHAHDGNIYYIQPQVIKINDSSNVLILKDVSEVSLLRYHAYHDSLTDTFNRLWFEMKLKDMSSLEDGLNHSLVFIDLDHFKNVNDQFGHAVGDTVLINVVNTIKDNIRTTDCLARLGGDEFGLILFGCGVDKASLLTQNIIEMIIHSSIGMEFNIGASAGVTLIVKGTEVSCLLMQADSACYQAKRNGRGFVYLYNAND